MWILHRVKYLKNLDFNKFCLSNIIYLKDLTPANIMFYANGDVKLIDFGLSRYYASPNKLLSRNPVTRLLFIKKSKKYLKY
jgi:serine/threonine protein kinase